MIITCQNCDKKFVIEQNLISEKGRLLQCSSCNYKWFFKKEIEIKTIKLSTNENSDIYEIKKPHVNNLIDEDNSASSSIATSTNETVKKIENNKIKLKKKNNLLNITIVFFISFIALVILLDTFSGPLSKIVPDLEFLLYNLYESIKDIGLFIRDLI
tara:strand:- start:271 stop:741 length:471 start_codon:yes stop_codon:yes gene_type:complete